MSVVIVEDDGSHRIVSKGASEMVFAACKYYYSADAGKIFSIPNLLKR